MTEKAQPSVAVIGMGYWGKNLVRNFHELGALATICDSQPEAGARAAEAYPETRFLAKFDDVLDDKTIDAVVLATPAATHADLAIRALDAGKDVLVEKPLALTIDEGQKVVDTARQRSRILMVGHILRYHPAVIALEELVRQGALGELRYCSSNRLNMGKIRTEENILWSFAPHDISVMLALLGENPTSIICEGGAYLNRDVADVTLSQFTFPSGVRAHIYVSWLNPFKEQRFVLIGSKKAAVFDDTAQDKLVIFPHEVAWEGSVPTAVKKDGQPVVLESTEPLRAECTHFLECVTTRRTPITDGEEGLRVLTILEACQKALGDITS